MNRDGTGEDLTVTTTIQRIDRLSHERSRPDRLVLDSQRSDRGMQHRIAEITGELDQLWVLRHRERVGKLSGIDLLVERSYAQNHGEDNRDAVAPPAVEEQQDTIALVA